MSDAMVFPETWEEFERSYGFIDEEKVYTNGSRLISSFRVEQWLDHCKDKKTSPHWHTGTPTEEGWYLLAVNFKGTIGYKANIWTNIIGWQWMMSVSGEVVAWKKIDEYKEEADGKNG